MSLILKRARFNAGLSQEKLAERAGVSAETVRRIELGSHPNAATAKAIADALSEVTGERVQPTDLFSLEDGLDPDPHLGRAA